jgi:hypothetical protein
VSETLASGPRQFLADLAAAMRAAAEAGRETTIEQCHVGADAYVQHLREEATSGQAALKEVSAEDIALLRDRSRAQAQLVREESERRIRRRRELLDATLAEYSQAAQAELQRVEKHLADWEAELGKFYDQLAEQTDPTIFASFAATMPTPPDFADPDPAQLVRELRGAGEPAKPVEEPIAEEHPAGPETTSALPDHWWLDSPVALAGRKATGG